MEIVLWVLQGVLALLFLGAGLAKLTQGKKLQPRLAWMEDFSEPVVRFIGAVEVLGAIGLVLPPLVGIAPVLAPLAAVGLAITMVLAAITHGRRGETQMIVGNVVLLVLLLVVAWGRFGPYAF